MKSKKCNHAYQDSHFNIIVYIDATCGADRMVQREKLFLLIALLLGLVMSACTGTKTQEVVPPTDAIGVEVEREPTQGESTDPTTEPTQAAEVESAPEEVSTPTEETQKPELKTSLVSTDPESVNLTSGKPTLVEFFAFW
jgi:hypothetical protein